MQIIHKAPMQADTHVSFIQQVVVGTRFIQGVTYFIQRQGYSFH